MLIHNGRYAMTFCTARKLCKALAGSIASILLAFTPFESKAFEQSWYPPGPIDMFVESPQPTVCLGVGPCEGPWVQPYSHLGLGEVVSLSSSATSFGFYLGNTLSGTFEVSISPAFRIMGVEVPAYAGGGYVPAHDELIVHVADRFAVLSKTDFGHSSFTAQTGKDYYVFLAGVIRGDQVYNMQVTQVPEPASWLFFCAGIGILLALRRRETLGQSLRTV